MLPDVELQLQPQPLSPSHLLLTPGPTKLLPVPRGAHHPILGEEGSEYHIPTHTLPEEGEAGSGQWVVQMSESAGVESG